MAVGISRTARRSYPEIRGKQTSRTTTHGRSRWAISTASSPLLAQIVDHPALRITSAATAPSFWSGPTINITGERLGARFLDKNLTLNVVDDVEAIRTKFEREGGRGRLVKLQRQAPERKAVWINPAAVAYVEEAPSRT